MSITNYSELKSAIANWLDQSDLTSRIPEFIKLAEDRIAQTLRIRAMEASADVTVSAQTAALPTSFLAQRRLYLSHDRKRLDYFPPEDFWDRYGASETGAPAIYTIEGDNYVFGPAPDTSYTAKSLYYKRLTALSGDTDTNWIFTNAVGLLLYGSLLEACLFLEDEAGTLKYSTLFDDLAERVKSMDKMDRFPAGSLVMRSDVRSLSESST